MSSHIDLLVEHARQLERELNAAKASYHETLKWHFLLTKQVDDLPYQPPRPKRTILTRIMAPFLGGRNTKSK